jgi:hypothetical protein
MRRPFLTKACLVSEDNIDEVAKWCGGVVLQNEFGRSYIRVPVENPRNVRQTEAHVGQWVMRSRHRGLHKFKVYTPAWVAHDFITVSGGEEYDDQDDPSGQEETMALPKVVQQRPSPKPGPPPTKSDMKKTPRIIDHVGSIKIETI